MGTLSDELAMTILRNFQIAQLDVAAQWQEDLQTRADKLPRWSWSPGTFVFPEALCCYCGGVMASPAIWRAVELQFYGSWKVVEGADYFDFDDTHPHVNNGSICMGGEYRASSVADALFLAFNPLSSYFHGENDRDGNPISTTESVIKDWFADRFNHTCGDGPAVQAAEGIDLRHVVAAEDGCFCINCRMHRGDVRCNVSGCGQWYDRRVGHGRFRCREVCDRALRLHFCVKHRHERKECERCGATYDLYDTETGTVFAEDAAFISQCETCGKWLCSECEDRKHGCTGVEPESGCNHECCSDCCRTNGCDTCEDCDNYPPDCAC